MRGGVGGAVSENLFNSDPTHPDCELWCCSDEENDEDMDSIYYLPVAPEIDDPEETGWTQEVCGKNRTLVQAS